MLVVETQLSTVPSPFQSQPYWSAPEPDAEAVKVYAVFAWPYCGYDVMVAPLGAGVVGSYLMMALNVDPLVKPW